MVKSKVNFSIDEIHSELEKLSSEVNSVRIARDHKGLKDISAEEKFFNEVYPLIKDFYWRMHGKAVPLGYERE